MMTMLYRLPLPIVTLADVVTELLRKRGFYPKLLLAALPLAVTVECSKTTNYMRLAATKFA